MRHQWKWLFVFTVSVYCLGGGGSSGILLGAAIPQELPEADVIRQEMAIMNGIIKTTAGFVEKEIRPKKETGKDLAVFPSVWGSSISNLYLQGQGAVFLVSRPNIRFSAEQFAAMDELSVTLSALSEDEWTESNKAMNELRAKQQELQQAREQARKEAKASQKELQQQVEKLQAEVEVARQEVEEKRLEAREERRAKAEVLRQMAEEGKLSTQTEKTTTSSSPIPAPPAPPAPPSPPTPSETVVTPVTPVTPPAPVFSGERTEREDRIYRVAPRRNRQKREEDLEEQKLRVKEWETKMVERLRKVLIQHGDALSFLKPAEYITVILTPNDNIRGFSERSAEAHHVLMIQKNYILDFKKGTLSGDQLQTRFVEYTLGGNPE